MIKVGADPEFFLQNTEGKLISAVGLIGGNKQFPKEITEVGHAIQEDNVAFEFNIPPSDSAREFVEHLNYVLSHLEHKIKPLQLKFAKGIASASFPEDQLMSAEAQVFGCEPDMNAWTRKQNPRPLSLDYTLRSCGGHVHIGAPMKDVAAVMRRCDLFLAVPSVLMDRGQLRKQLYGKAGAFRPKSYGGEYRVLSNFWVFSPDTVKWVFRNTQLALDAEHLNVEEEQQTIIDAINNNNVEAAKFLINKYSIPVLHA